MSESAVETLFDEFATRYVRGERPDVREYLERAGAEREELGGMLDRFLQAVPAREPSEEETVLLQARLESEPPILVLRHRRRLTRESVVAALVGGLGLDPAKQGKVGRYYHELETGLLDPDGVSGSVWEALADFMKANVRALAVAPPPPHAAPAAGFRRDADFEMPVLFEQVVLSEPPKPDEIDRLFTAGN